MAERDKHPCGICLKKVPFAETTWAKGVGSVCMPCFNDMPNVRVTCMDCQKQTSLVDANNVDPGKFRCWDCDREARRRELEARGSGPAEESAQEDGEPEKAPEAETEKAAEGEGKPSSKATLPRVLYVDRSVDSTVVSALEAEFRLDVMAPLTEKILDRVMEQSGRDGYQGLVTHFPFNKKRGDLSHESNLTAYMTLYSDSLELVGQIKRYDPDLTVVVYTGMDKGAPMISTAMTDRGIDHILHKGSDKGSDAREIVGALWNGFKESRIDYRQGRPFLRVENGTTSAVALVNCRTGFGWSEAMTLCQHIARRTKGKAKREVKLAVPAPRPGGAPEEVSLLDPSELIPLFLSRGSRVTVKVQNLADPDPEAADLVLELCSAFGAQYGFDVRYDIYK